jgi:hypothetical protein
MRDIILKFGHLSKREGDNAAISNPLFLKHYSDRLRKTFFMVARTFLLGYEYSILNDLFVHVEVRKPNRMESSDRNSVLASLSRFRS